jgi:uncharacterized RDD family membrane protein YckC
METAILNEFQEERREYAGFWIRVGAYLIDSFVIGIPAAIISFIGITVLMGTTMDFNQLMYDPEYMPSDGEMFAFVGGYLVMILLLSIIATLYFAILHSSKWQATVGKKLVGIKVTDLNGNRITFWRAFGRLFAMILSGILYIGYIMVAFTEKKQGLHDMIAGTLVLKK